MTVNFVIFNSFPSEFGKFGRKYRFGYIGIYSSEKSTSQESEKELFDKSYSIGSIDWCFKREKFECEKCCWHDKKTADMYWSKGEGAIWKRSLAKLCSGASAPRDTNRPQLHDRDMQQQCAGKTENSQASKCLYALCKWMEKKTCPWKSQGIQQGHQR